MTAAYKLKSEAEKQPPLLLKFPRPPINMTNGESELK